VGQEMNCDVTILEAGLESFVKLNKKVEEQNLYCIGFNL